MIDLGSFNNCKASRNFLNRTALSDFLIVDLLDYDPKFEDFEYEKNLETQSRFCPFLTRKELKKFKLGVHYLDS